MRRLSRRASLRVVNPSTSRAPRLQLEAPPTTAAQSTPPRRTRRKTKLVVSEGRQTGAHAAARACVIHTGRRRRMLGPLSGRSGAGRPRIAPWAALMVTCQCIGKRPGRCGVERDRRPQRRCSEASVRSARATAMSRRRRARRVRYAAVTGMHRPRGRCWPDRRSSDAT